MMTLFDRIATRARGKSALYDLHPELLDRVPLLRSYSDEAGLPSGQANFMSYYSTNAWVYKAIKVVSDAVCQLRLVVVRDQADGEIEYEDTHEITSILANPNPSQGGADFWREWCILMLLAGDVGAEMVYGKGSRTKMLELWLRSPETIIIKAGPLGLRYRDVSTYKIDDGSGAPYELSPEEFIFWRFANPLNAWRGISPLSAVRLGVTIDALAQAWTRLFFKNNARPDFALVAPAGITKSEKESYEQALDQRTGADQPHRPIVLESGITDIKVLSFPPKDLEWLEQRKFSRDEVGAIYGVPDEIMGYGKDTYENFNAADRVLWTLTIVPLVSFRDSALTHKFKRLKMLAPNERIATDLSEVDQLREDVTDKVNQLNILAGRGYPINELSPFLDLDLPAVEGGDIGYLPSNMIPISMAGTIQPQPQLPPSEPAPGKSVRKHFMLPYGSTAHDAVWKYHQARLTPFVEEMQRILKKEFQRQASEIDRKLRDSKDFGRGRYKVSVDIPTTHPPVIPAKVPPVIQLFDPTEEEILFEEVLKPLITNAVAKLGAAAIEDVVSGRIFEVHNPHVQQGIDQVLNAVSNKTNDTTWTQLVELFQEAEAAGEGIPAIQERLSAYFGERKSDWQTERIARTTMTGSNNLANTEAWDQSGVVKGKTWISALIPGRTREDHWNAHGQTVGLHESFSVGGESLEYPGDPIGSPGNIINCLPGFIEVVSVGNIENAFSRPYSGLMIEIRTDGGHILTVTPNHPILTNRGWVVANEINNLDSLIGCSGAEWARFGNPEINNRPSIIEQVFSALSMSGIHQRVAGRPENFHGDGGTGYIDIITTNRILRDRSITSAVNDLKRNLLIFPNEPGFVPVVDSPGSGSGDDTFRLIPFEMSGNMGGSSHLNTLFGSQFGQSKSNRIWDTSQPYTSRNQPAMNNSPIGTNDTGDFLLGVPGFVQSYKVISKNISSFSGHVYNLQTESGFYLSNGIITHNCLCVCIGETE